MDEVEWYKSYWTNGQLYNESPFVNKKRHGKAKWYYEDGQLAHEIPHIDGQIHGVTSRYNRDGTLGEQNIWINGEIRNDLLGDEHRLTRLALLGSET